MGGQNTCIPQAKTIIFQAPGPPKTPKAEAGQDSLSQTYSRSTGTLQDNGQRGSHSAVSCTVSKIQDSGQVRFVVPNVFQTYWEFTMCALPRNPPFSFKPTDRDHRNVRKIKKLT